MNVNRERITEDVKKLFSSKYSCYVSVISWIPFTSKFTLPCLLCKNGYGTLNIFLFPQLAVSWCSRGFAGGKAFPPRFKWAHLAGLCNILGHSSAVQPRCGRLLDFSCLTLGAHTASPSSGSCSVCETSPSPSSCCEQHLAVSGASGLPLNPT